MGAGDFFGEIGILNLDGGVNKYVLCATYRLQITLFRLDFAYIYDFNFEILKNAHNYVR